MKIVQLIHNPTAGDEDHDREELVKQIEEAGFTCRYSSTKSTGWKLLPEDTDLIAVAGGDGTVRKVVRQLLKNEALARRTAVAVLAMGTANNIAKTLNVGNDATAVQLWKESQRKKVDIGEIENVPDASFFLEGLGFGIFPELMKEMQEKEEVYASPEEELKGALKVLHQVLLGYRPCRCQLEVDGTDHSGRFFMVEVMNIRSIGPNLVLAPQADPGDGEFEVVLVPEAHQEKFADYLLHKITSDDDPYQFPTLKGKNIRIRWEGNRLHVDDKLLKQEKGTEITIRLKEGALQFLVPNDEPANG